MVFTLTPGVTKGSLQSIYQALVALVSGEGGGAGYGGEQVSVTRPADTTAYTANDVVGAAAAAITFPDVAPADGGSVMIVSASLEFDLSAVPASMTTFRLYLYSATPPSALADNAAFDLPSGDRDAFLGYIDLGTPVDIGSTLYVQTDNINKPIKLDGADLFGYLVTAGGFTPASETVHRVTLSTVVL